jgi:hypothetical protein
MEKRIPLTSLHLFYVVAMWISCLSIDGIIFKPQKSIIDFILLYFWIWLIFRLAPGWMLLDHRIAIRMKQMENDNGTD